MSPNPIDGPTFLAAVVAGYEVATRFGYALTRDDRWHTHGHWGATGAATAAAVIWGADADGIAAAIDTSTALIHVSPWAVVLDGNFARNLWIGGAVGAGLDGARLTQAGLVANSGAVAHTLGDIVGTLDLDRLTEDLGQRWLLLEGYSKQHASCSYTHAAVDAVQSLKKHASWNIADIEQVRVRTHSLAEPLFGRHPTTRLGAMFSLPFVVAAAFIATDIDGPALDPAGPVFPIAEEFSSRVKVSAAAEFDALLPRRRAAEVSIAFHNGEELTATAPNPIGDVDHFPMDHKAIHAKVARLIGDGDANALAALIARLPDSADVAALLTEAR